MTPKQLFYLGLDPRQKLKPGTRVVAGPLPKEMSHFSTGFALVIYSYASACGHSDCRQEDFNQYALCFDEGDYSAWYPGEYLYLAEDDKLAGGVDK